MPQPDRILALRDEAPSGNAFTAYDEAHFAIYLSLLHASGEGMSEEEMSRLIFGIEPGLEPERARRAVESHLKRARWLAENGCRHLLENQTI